MARTNELVQTFVAMVRQRTGEQLDMWLADVAASQIPELRTFANGLQRDYAPVKHGLTLPESNSMSMLG